MHAERDWLRKVVFPELEERLRPRRCHLEMIDLRWGVDDLGEAEEARREAEVLRVCFDEIERSRPFFIGLLGDRYGWCPPVAPPQAEDSGAASATSVTELEILFGVLSCPDQRRRSWCYLRGPLPYDEMAADRSAQYGIGHGDPGAASGAARLEALKQRLEAEHPDRTRRYSAAWDVERQRVTDLEPWGRQVIEDVWSDLEEETRRLLEDAPRTWQEDDRRSLEEFVEHRARDFTGREATTTDLLGLCLSPATEPTPWGACVTGEPGSGKSSLFGFLYRSLGARDVLVLGHAAGVSPRSSLVDRMLRRWGSELAAFLAEPDGIDDVTASRDVERIFLDRLARTSARTRVVILVDALDQFEPTVRGRHVTWLPQECPGNVRFIGTTVPGIHRSSVLRRDGLVDYPLPPIGEQEAATIIAGVCRRYHRAIDQVILRALLDKCDAEGQPAHYNLLWLELATAHLNQVGEEEFERWDAGGMNSPAGLSGVRQLLLDVVASMSPTVPGLYDALLDQAERVCGRAGARSFARLICLSRSGWRESDLRTMMHSLSGEEWDDLRFATLRRLFRGQVVQRGFRAEWDFAHPEMRRAMRARMAREGVDVPALHDEIVEHVWRLAVDDPVRILEATFHVLRGARPSLKGALHLGSLTTSLEIEATAESLSDYVLEGLADGSDAHLGVLTSLFSEKFVGPNLMSGVVMVLGAADAQLEGRAPLEVRRRLSEARHRVMELLPPPVFEINLSMPIGHSVVGHEADISHRQLRQCIVAIENGDVLFQSRRFDEAEGCYGQAWSLLEALTERVPQFPALPELWATCLERAGDLRLARGEPLQAVELQQRALELRRLVGSAAGDQLEHESRIATTLSKIGDALLAGGRPQEAAPYYEEAHDLAAACYGEAPESPEGARTLALIKERLGDVALASGDLAAAERFFAWCVAAWRDLTRQDPEAADWHRNRALVQGRLGEVHRRRGELTLAVRACAVALEIHHGLASKDPTNPQWQGDLASAFGVLGDALIEAERYSEALEAQRGCLAILESLAESTAIVGLERNVSIAYERIGDCEQCLGRSTEAQGAYETCRAMRDALIASHPGNTKHLRDGVRIHLRLARLAAEIADDGRQAEPSLRPALGLRRELVRLHPDDPEVAAEMVENLRLLWMCVSADGARKTEADALSREWRAGLQAALRRHPQDARLHEEGQAYLRMAGRENPEEH